MPGTKKLKFASFLYQYLFPVYRKLYFNYKNKKDGNYLELMRELIRPGFSILDIGSNIGFYTKFFSEQVGSKGHVVAFEPDQTNFGHLKKELKNKSNVTLVQKAVASTSGTLTLYTSPLLNVDHRTYEPESFTASSTVEKISVDDFVSGRFQVDLIKMDIQGFEMEALKGMKNTLSANPDIYLVMELWPYGLEKAGSSAAEIFDFLGALGFRIYRIDSGKTVPMKKEEAEKMKAGYFTDANLLAVRKEL